jgi:hypothetical protein
MLDDVRLLDAAEGKWRLMKEKMARIEPDEFDYVALGYTLSNLYGVMEGYFLRVAKAFENRIEPSRWHRDLLDRMAIDVSGIRPAVLRGEEKLAIDELCAFRHVFRHIYQGQLDVEKLSLVDRRAPAALAAFRDAHQRFLLVIEDMMAAVTSIEDSPPAPA